MKTFGIAALAALVLTSTVAAQERPPALSLWPYGPQQCSNYTVHGHAIIQGCTIVLENLTDHCLWFGTVNRGTVVGYTPYLIDGKQYCLPHLTPSNQ